MTKQPAIFVGHGSPMLAIEPGGTGDFWASLGKTLARPDAVIAVSAHWETAAPVVSTALRQTTIHDFYGFPEALFDIDYPAHGAPELAQEVLEALKPLGASADNSRGLDHGAWVPLRAMYPDADIPVFQLSVQPGADGRHHLALGKTLAPFRDRNVLVLASGSLTHNLHHAFPFMRNNENPPPLDYAERFDRLVTDLVQRRDADTLADYDNLPDFATAHPSPEHYLPLLVAMGAGSGPGRSIHEGFTLAALSMHSYAFD